MAVQFPSSQSTSVSLADLFRRAVGHHGSGQLDEALRLYTRLLDANFQAFKVSELAGIASMQLGDYRLAVSYFRLARSCQPINHSILNNLGVSLKNIDQLNEAAASLRLAIELAPNYAEAHNNLGIAYGKKGWVRQAAEEISLGMKLKSRDGR